MKREHSFLVSHHVTKILRVYWFIFAEFCQKLISQPRQQHRRLNQQLKPKLQQLLLPGKLLQLGAMNEPRGGAQCFFFLCNDGDEDDVKARKSKVRKFDSSPRNFAAKYFNGFIIQIVKKFQRYELQIRKITVSGAHF